MTLLRKPAFSILCILVPVCCSALAGCEQFYGVRRVSPLASWPSVECVKHAIEGTPGVESVAYSHREGGTYFRWSGCSTPADITDNFLFQGTSGSHIRGSLQIYGDCAGPKWLTLSEEYMNHRPPQVLIDATRPVMTSIAKRVEAQCDIGGLVASMKEECNGVTCAPEPPSHE